MDLKREYLKIEFDKLVDDHHGSLVKDLKDFESNFMHFIEPKIKEFNTEQIRLYLNNQDQNFKSKNEFIANLNKNKIDQLFTKMEKFKNVKFIQSAKPSKYEMAEMFGTLGLKEIFEDLKLCSKQPDTKSQLPFSSKFSLKCQFGLNTFLELSTGELVSSSLWDPSNFLTVHPYCTQITEFPGHKSKFNFMFLADNDVIVTISDDFFIRAWKDFKCFKYIPLERLTIIAAELFKYNVITVNYAYHFQFVNFETGQTIKKFNLNLSPISLIKPLSHAMLLTAHENQFIIWNIDNLKEKERLSFNGLVSSIETINTTEFFIGTNNGQVIKWHRKATFRSCHPGPVSCIHNCNNGKILTISCQDNRLKFWECKNFDLLYEISLYMPYVGKILKCSKFCYIDQQGKLYISD